MNNKRKLGSYYTPEFVSLAIAKWAIREGNETIIDPTFGGCSFIKSALRILKQKGAESYTRQLNGCDIDPIAFDFLRKILPDYDTGRFQDADFMSAEFTEKFDVIIGNPPYIKHDNIPENALKNARAAVLGNEIVDILVRPNYWVYFLIKSITLLKENGRMAFILPQNFLNAQYSILVQRYLRSFFHRIDIFPIKDQIFEGTSESTALILFEGFSSSIAKGDIYFHNSVLGRDIQKTIIMNKNGKNYKDDFIPNNSQESLSLINSLSKKYSLRQLNYYYSVKIGVVTGAKKYFILSKQEAKELKLPIEYLLPVFSKASDLNSIIVQPDIVNSLPKLLAIPESYTYGGLLSNSDLDKYIDSASPEVRNTAHSKSRKPWYSVRRVFVPDAFIKNVVKNNFAIYSNHSNATCTNNILRLNIIGNHDKDSLSLFSLTSLFQLSAILNSINYGKDAYKLEPNGVNKMILPYSSLNHKTKKTALAIIAHNDGAAARAKLDTLLLHRVLKMEKDDIVRVSLALQQMKHLRE